MSFSFVAKPGFCANDACTYDDNKIRAGDECVYFEDEIMHMSCATRAPHQQPPYCPTCWQYHRGECP